MKLLYFANTDWYLYNFRLPLLESVRQAGHDVLLLSPPGEYAQRLVEAGFSWRPFPLDRRGTHPLREAATVARLVRIYREEQPDLVHHFTIKCVLYGSLAARWAGVSHVVNAVTGLGHVFIDRGPRAAVLRPLVGLLYRLALARSAVIFQNPDDQAAFAALGLTRRAQTFLIRGSGVDVQRFQPRCHRPEGPITIFFAGRLLREKGVVELLQAARQVLAQRPNVRFRLAGDPDPGNPSSIDVDTLSNEWRDSRLEFRGHRDDMVAELAAADLVVLPSYREGTPRVLLEAAAAGLPLVATDVPGCREVVQHEVNGLLVPVRTVEPLAAAMLRLIDDPALRQRYGAASRTLALQAFAQEKVISATLAVYSSAFAAD